MVSLLTAADTGWPACAGHDKSELAPRCSAPGAPELRLRLDVEPHRDIFEVGPGRRIALHDQRIVARNDVRGRARELHELAVAFQRVADVVDGREQPALLAVRIE